MKIMTDISKSSLGKGTADTYILFLSEEERKEKNIKTELPSFNRDEIQMFRDSLVLPRLLLLVAKQSLGKADYNLEKQSEELKAINGWINDIQKRISLAQEVKQSLKGENDQSINMNMEGGLGGLGEVKKFNISLKEMCVWADANGIKIDIDRKSTDTSFKGFLKPDPSDYIEQLQRISGTLNAEIKNITTKVQKFQTDANTFTEMMSAVYKKFNDLISAILSKTQ